MDASSDIWKSVMFSLQRKLSGCCWHKIQHFLDCDLLVCYKMSPGHMTCFCFAPSNSVLKIFKWCPEKGWLWALVSPPCNYSLSSPCRPSEPCKPRGLILWLHSLVWAGWKALCKYRFIQLMSSLEKLQNKDMQSLTTVSCAV